MVDLAVEASRPLIEDCHHRLTVALPGYPVLLEVDPARMAQVLSNLLNNAAKYTDEGGEIALSAVQQGREVVIRVRDNGTGIAPELLPHVFDMFTQADQTLSRSRGGLGIGLTLVRSLVEMHQGRVTAHSGGAGKGSEFTVRLPISRDATASPGDEPPADDAPGHFPRRRILVVDDNRSNATSLGVLLRAWARTSRWPTMARPPSSWSDTDVPTSSCSTSACPAWTATRSPAAAARTTTSAASCSWP